MLLAMVEVPGSVAYLTFTDFEDRIRAEEIETAAVLAMEKSPKDLSESDIIDLRAQSHALGAMLQEAEGKWPAFFLNMSSSNFLFYPI